MYKWYKVFWIILKRKRALYFVLALITGAMLTIYARGAFGDLASNLLAEVIGICITIFVLDFIIAFQDEKRIFKLKSLAYSQIRSLLCKAIELIKNQYKAASGNVLESTGLGGIDTNIAKSICSGLNLDNECADIYERPVNWQSHNRMFVERFKNAIELIIDNYINYLPEELIENLEKLKGSAIFEFYRVSASIRRIHRDQGIKENYLTGCSQLYIELFDILRLIERQLVDFGLPRT